MQCLNCAYRDICKISEENKPKCKFWKDEPAQEFRRNYLMGYPIEELLQKQYDVKRCERRK